MAAVAIAGLWILVHRPSQEPVQSSFGPSVELATVRYGDFAVVLDESGSAGAPAGTASPIAFPLAGTIATVFVRVGQRVSAGEPLASLDTRSLALSAQGAVADARAADAQARAASVDRYSTKLAVDRAAVTRARNLYQAGVAAAKDIQAASAQLAADEADARAAAAGRGAADASAQSASVKAQLAANDLSRAVLRSPVDGVVTAIAHRAGESVDPTMPVISVGPVQQAEATLHVPSSDASQIAAGDPAEIAAAGSATASRGRVTAVVPSVDPNTQSATVVVTGLPRDVVGGSAISAKITVAHVRGLIVPQRAIVQDPQSGDTIVFVQTRRQDGSTTFQPRTVVVVHEDGTFAQIRGPMRPGDRIAAQGAFELLAPASD